MQTTFSKLDQILTDYAELWRTSPFTNPVPAWRDAYPLLFNWLMTLSLDDVEVLQGDDNLLCQQMAPYFPVAKQIYSLIQLPVHSEKTGMPRSYAWQRDVPGRKVEQIEAFAAATGVLSDPLLEWCSGKLHLGRYLAEQYHVPVVGLEINGDLVSQANQLAQRMHSDARVEQCDVLTEAAQLRLTHKQHAIALHACGGLHVSLLQASVAQQAKRVTLAPCCYHRFNASDHYQPLSQTARNSSLVLTMEDLRTAVRQSNTAAERERLKRKQLQAWRLGFDLMQREIRGVDEYLPVPSVSVTRLNNGFVSFCQHVASLKGLEIPAAMNIEAYEVRGEQRFLEFSRMELVRMAFRRALECWLVLDRVLYLEEHGYQCRLTQFCSPLLTPRNLLIDAVRPPEAVR